MMAMECNANIKEAKDMNLIKWVNNVRTGGKWDYKNGGHPEMEHVGNFNYGATGRAAGIPAFILRGAGGIVQITTFTSSPEFWNSNFDDPIDQQYIQQGVDY